MIAVIATGAVASLFTWTYTASLPSAIIVLAAAFGLSLAVYYNTRTTPPEETGNDPPEPPPPSGGPLKPY